MTNTDPSQRNSDRLCPHPAVIPTDRPEAEAWNMIDQLTSLNFVHKMLNYRLTSDSFANLRQHIEDLNRRKQNFNQDNSDELLDIYEILSPTSRNMNHNATEITLLARQAIEFYRASQLITLYSKPILLYYPYIKLARILFLSTYEKLERKTGHGLQLDNSNDRFTVLRNGSFQRFHDSYSWDPCEFNWRDLIIARTKRHSIVLNMENCNMIELHELKSGNGQYQEHELAREFMFTYAMSMLARYKVQYWNELIEGKKEDVIWLINEYLTSTQTLFPNLIYNQLRYHQSYFYPVGHELFEVPRNNPNQFPWLL